METLSNLKSIDPSGLKKLWIGTGAVDLDIVATAGLNADLVYRRTPTNRVTANLTHVKRVVDHFTRLPADGETYHAVLSGRYPLWAIVPAILTLAGCAIEELSIVTLSLSKENGEELFTLLDDGHVKSATLLVSHYFAGTNFSIYEPIANGMKQRGQRIMAARCHAKITNVKMVDGRCYSIESSANQRSCRNVEQLTWTAEKNLYEFHRQWIHNLIDTNQTTDRVRVKQ